MVYTLCSRMHSLPLLLLLSVIRDINFESVIPDPCEEGSVCGTCAICRVVNHGVQCSCPANFLGNPLVSCSKPSVRCGIGMPDCDCDESGYCTKNCAADHDCSCGETCAQGKCRTKCSGPSSCAQVNVIVHIPSILLNAV